MAGVQKHAPGCNCCGGCTATLHLHTTDNCSAANLSGVSLTASKSGQADVTGTSNSSGLVDLTVTEAGTWSVQGVKTGYTTKSIDVVSVCDETTNADLKLIQTGQVTNRTVSVTGCTGVSNSNCSDAFVELIQSGSVLLSGYTGSTGGIVFSDVPGGSYTARASKARYNTVTSSSFTVTCGSSGTTNIALTPAKGYECVSGQCQNPIPQSLYLTDPIYGTFPVTSSNGIFVCNYIADLNTYAGSVGGNCTSGPTSGFIAIQIQMPWSLTGTPFIRAKSCNSSGVPVKMADTCPISGAAFTFSGISRTFTSCDPFLFTFVAHYDSSSVLYKAFYGTVDRTFTISE